MENDEKGLLVKIKEKANEFGLLAKDEVYGLLAKSTSLLPAVIGNELVLATFIPMIPSLAVDIIKREILAKHIPDLGRELNSRKDKLNEEYVKSARGRKLFKDVIGQILEETNEEKIEYHKTFLINSYITKDKDEETISSYREILMSSSITSMKILQALLYPERWIQKLFESKKGQEEGDYFSYAIKRDLAKILNVEQAVFDRAAERLESDKIITTEGATVNWSERRYHYSELDQAVNQATTEVKRMITPYGKEFFEFVTKKL